MPDEEKVSQERQEGVVETPTVDSAGEGAGEKEQVQQSQEQVHEEPTEHRERSQLGRKVKGLEDSLRTLTDNLNIYFQQQRPNQQPSIPQPEPEKYDPSQEYVTTAADVKKVYERERMREERERQIKVQQQQQARVNYMAQYKNTVNSLALNDEEGSEVLAEVLKEESPFNRIIWGDPVRDAQINYSDASGAIAKKKLAAYRNKPNVRGERSQVSTNISVSQREGSGGPAMPELDTDAQEYLNYIKRTGGKEEDYIEAVKNEPKYRISGKTKPLSGLK